VRVVPAARKGNPAEGHAPAVTRSRYEITVLLSVVVRLAAAGPLVARHAGHLVHQAGRRATAGMPDVPARGLVHRTSRIDHPQRGEQPLAR
jgi:hypothetical protein